MPKKKTYTKKRKKQVAKLVVPWYVTLAALAASIAAMSMAMMIFYR